MFAPISATPLDEHGRPIEAPQVYATDSSADDDPNGEIPDFVGAAGGIDSAPIPFALDPTPLTGHVPPPVADPVPAGAPKTSALARRRQLREQNASAVVDLVHMTGRTHAEVNSELNRKVGIKRVTVATLRQLEQRLAAAQTMLKRR